MKKIAKALATLLRTTNPILVGGAESTENITLSAGKTVDGKDVSTLPFLATEAICLRSLNLPIYTPQSVTGTTHTNLKMIDNATDLIFRIGNLTPVPSGWTVKGLLSGIMKTSNAAQQAHIELYNITDTVALGDTYWTAVAYVQTFNTPFDLPTYPSNLVPRIWNTGAADTTYCAGAWIDMIIVKD